MAAHFSTKAILTCSMLFGVFIFKDSVESKVPTPFYTKTKEGCICYMIYAPICASNGKTYANDCFLKCEQKTNPYLLGICHGECPCCKTQYHNTPPEVTIGWGVDEESSGWGWGWGMNNNMGMSSNQEYGWAFLPSSTKFLMSPPKPKESVVLIASKYGKKVDADEDDDTTKAELTKEQLEVVSPAPSSSTMEKSKPIRNPEPPKPEGSDNDGNAKSFPLSDDPSQKLDKVKRREREDDD